MIRASAILAVSLAALAFVRNPPSTETLELTRPFLPNALVEGCGHCHDCEDPGYGDGHDFHETEPEDLNGLDHECLAPLLCGEYHSACGEPPLPEGEPAPEESELVFVLSMLPVSGEQDPVAIRRLLAAYPHRVRISRNREALQVSGDCSPDYIVAQIPLTRAIAAQLP